MTILARAGGVALAAFAILAPAMAHAADEPKNAVSVGVYGYVFSSKSTDLKGPSTPPDIRSSARNTATLALLYGRTLSPHWTANLAVGIPPKYTLQGEGHAEGLGKLGTAQAVSPAFMFEYHFIDFADRVTPYAGAGVSVTHFMSPKASESLNTALGGKTKVEVDDIVSPAVTAGVDFDLTERRFVTVSAVYVPHKADATLTTGPIERTQTITLNPLILRATMGFRF